MSRDVAELMKNVAASNDPEAKAAVARLQTWSRAETALATAKTAVADAERLHAGRLTDLNLAVASAEQIAAPLIAAVAEAQDAVAEAQAAHQVHVSKLREALAQAEVSCEAALDQLKA